MSKIITANEIEYIFYMIALLNKKIQYFFAFDNSGIHLAADLKNDPFFLKVD